MGFWNKNVLGFEPYQNVKGTLIEYSQEEQDEILERAKNGELRNDENDRPIVVSKQLTEEEIKARRYTELKTELAKTKEDIEQENFGIVRDDFTEKKVRAAEIINELRVLEGKEPREVNNK